MTKLLQHFYFFIGAMLLAFPVLFFNSSWTILNMILDGSILMLINILSIVLVLESEIRKFRFKSISLLVIACISVLAIFLRIVPMPLGISLAFLIPVCSGVVFGPAIGFLVGQFSMIFGSLIIGGFGPWIASQAFLMGAIGYYSGILFHKYRKIIPVFIYVMGISFFYGYFMTVSYWPVAINDSSITQELTSRFRSYNQYYVVTSFIWDVTRIFGNAVIFYFLFRPTCELMERAKKRLTYYN